MSHRMPFSTRGGLAVPAVTALQMREVDRIAVEDFGLGVLQMMENAGRNLAENAIAMLGGAPRRKSLNMVNGPPSWLALAAMAAEASAVPGICTTEA